MVKPTKTSSGWLPLLLGCCFVFAVFMGAGPGVMLVSPDPASTEPTATLFGAPIVYAWFVLWLFVEAAIVLIASQLIWAKEDKDAL